MAKKQERIRCNQCEAAMINGVFCHETGCPNSKKRYIDGEWLAVRECFECGFEVIGDAECCNEEDENTYCTECGSDTDNGEFCEECETALNEDEDGE